jgi:hypothetical protein
MVKLFNKKYVLQDKPYQIVLDADRKTITANGEDISFVTVSVVDKMEFFALQRQTNSGYQGGYLERLVMAMPLRLKCFIKIP